MHTWKNSRLSRRDFMRRTGQGVAFTGGSLLAASASQAQTNHAAVDGGLRVGWATVSITPDMPVQLAGQFHERISTEDTLYPCLATALALEQTDAEGVTRQAILIACDLVNVGEDVKESICEKVVERLPDFDGRNLSINTTHTHTGPTLAPGVYKDPDPGVMGPLAYRPFFCERAAEAAVQAWEARQPGAMSHALGHAAVGFNRIAVYADGSSRMYGSSDRDDFRGLEGGHDHGLELVFLWNGAGEMSGMLINIACPAQVVEGQRYLSADFWGPVREQVKTVYGEHVSVYPMISAAGDQSPRDLVRRGRGEPNMRDESGMREMARRIMEGVRYAFDTAQSDVSASPVFRHHVETLDLPVRLVTKEEATEAQQERDVLLAADEDVAPGSRDAAMLRRARDVIERYESQTPASTYAINLHVLRLGDVVIATNPFELYLEYGVQIKARSKAAQTLVVQLANDRGRYLPTRRAVAGGAYGSTIASNRVGPEGGAILVDRTVAVINSMWDDE